MNRPMSVLAVCLLAGCVSESQPLAPRSDLLPLASSHRGDGGLLPDLQTVVPQQLQLVTQNKREILRFSNGIANTGAGPLHIRPEFPLDGTGAQVAIQVVFDAAGDVVSETSVSEFEFHGEHNHWHIAGTAQFEVRVGSHEGDVFGDNSMKVTFCLIDWVKLEGNSNTAERTYWDCSGTSEFQGISRGWVDQYHQALPGQDLDITGASTGVDYYLVSTANPGGDLLESNPGNNTAWVKFQILRESNGNPKLHIVEHSLCDGALCGFSANR